MPCINCKSSETSKSIISYSNVSFKQCRNCGCYYQDPLIELDYSDSYWQGAIDPDGIKRNFLKERDFKIKNWYGDAINFVNSKNISSVLDIGCGLGYFLSALKPQIKKYGVEDSKFACKYIKDNFQDINILNGSYELVENFKIKFDVVMFYHVIEHLKDPPKALKIIKKVLKKNGILILGTPNVESFVAKIFKSNYRHFIPAHTCLYGEKSISKLLKDHNFKVSRIERPFFKTNYNKFSNYLKLFNVNKTSPAFYGSIFTLYCTNS